MLLFHKKSMNVIIYILFSLLSLLISSQFTVLLCLIVLIHLTLIFILFSLRLSGLFK